MVERKRLGKEIYGKWGLLKAPAYTCKTVKTVKLSEENRENASWHWIGQKHKQQKKKEIDSSKLKTVHQRTL